MSFQFSQKLTSKITKNEKSFQQENTKQTFGFGDAILQLVKDNFRVSSGRVHTQLRLTQ
jgi:hypothetical protein